MVRRGVADFQVEPATQAPPHAFGLENNQPQRVDSLTLRRHAQILGLQYQLILLQLQFNAQLHK